ncbi:MAG TPA: 8-amino-7-oxononanoate synthase [Usitatibacter sp.]|jgi:8-amino-7-oxononanoate synthase|nr:8-amino-7-oxononanoate synthase [Usitatibacter sp.]
MGFDDRLAEGLAALDRETLRRSRRVLDSPQGARVRVDGRDLANFSSNDYLGLAADPRLIEAVRRSLDDYGVGAGASPLVSGHLRAHEEAEARFAAFTGLPRAILFGSGYAANLGILTVLAGPEAEVFGDRLNHACLHDGARLSRATYTRYPHVDVDALERALAASRAPVKVVATDAVFSMDGDVAPLPRLLDLCERHDAWLVVDDAHGIGVVGERGRGSLEHFGIASPRIVYMATLGKALGGYGAFVAGSPDAIEWILQRARTYVFSTALPPMMAVAASAAVELIEHDRSLLARLRARIAEFRAACAEAAVPVTPSGTAIQPVIVGDAARAVEVSARLLERGFLVPAIRPPTVPRGTSRLRVSLGAAHERADVERLARALAESLA